jgi:hypothetical protein
MAPTAHVAYGSVQQKDTCKHAVMTCCCHTCSLEQKTAPSEATSGSSHDHRGGYTSAAHYMLCHVVQGPQDLAMNTPRMFVKVCVLNAVQGERGWPPNVGV